jgi:pSer/pThr/pTyr-binding forkhead associated (FHA) protein
MDAGALAAPLPAADDANIQIPPAWLTLLQPSRGEPMRLDRQTIRIGRHNTNDIIVNERRVSRFHAEIKYEHGQFMLYDLRSVNGVQINGARATRPVPLQDRDIISVCGYEFIFQRR